MPLSRSELDVYECPSCGTVGRHEDERCCGEPMQQVESTAVFDSSELPAVLNEVLGLSETDLAVCFALGQVEEATVKELTGQLDRDRSTVSRSLSRLVERELVEERSRIPESGGRVNVYSSRPMKEVKRRLTRTLYGWVDAAAEQVDDLDRTKMELMAERASEPSPNPSPTEGDRGATMESTGGDRREKERHAQVERSLLDRVFGRQRS